MVSRGQYSEQNPSSEELIEAELQTVRRIAFYFYGRVKGAVEVDDLVQVGYLGLIDASQKYVKKSGVTFGSYAKIRIRGAIVDFLRRNSNLCRSTIAMKQKVNQTSLGLERKLQRVPSDEEVAQELLISVEELRKWQQAFEANLHQSIDEVHDEHSIWFVSDDVNPEEALSNQEIKRGLRGELEKLSEREAMVIQLYYVEELNVYEIAEILGISTGRVSQIKKSAIGHLRSGMASFSASAKAGDL
ncbi:sigma-70 family RNA polymerase sigma factor [uncultured Lentibacter sp.]|jgi:RNA polymerase sigma factor for flagellar operon FliA|uniref:sigma-70 family RNA polymerase sigma factor n=1 Tax=uncultured Lentibacter sp. TaxID=1659309 RepID=UPI00260C9366|nr:FliA/WhiG family RNA polymerase sigma factor [uncultured Lentibacter sp.]